MPTSKILLIISNIMDLIAFILATPKLLGVNRLIKIQTFFTNLANKGFSFLKGYDEYDKRPAEDGGLNSISDIKYFLITLLCLVTPLGVIFLIHQSIKKYIDLETILLQLRNNAEKSIVSGLLLIIVAILLMIVIMVSFFMMQRLIAKAIAKITSYLQNSHVSDIFLTIAVILFGISRFIAIWATIKS